MENAILCKVLVCGAFWFACTISMLAIHMQIAIILHCNRVSLASNSANASVQKQNTAGMATGIRVIAL